MTWDIEVRVEVLARTKPIQDYAKRKLMDAGFTVVWEEQSLSRSHLLLTMKYPSPRAETAPPERCRDPECASAKGPVHYHK